MHTAMNKSAHPRANGMDQVSGAAILDSVVRKGLMEKVTTEERFKRK